MDLDKPRDDCPTSPCTLPNGYVLPHGKLTPNTLFVGGIDMKVDENEIRDFFSKFGTVTEVKIISYRGGICKGYGFVYFGEEVEIQAIIAQQVSFKGRKLKLGPAIMKERSSRTYPSPMTNHLNGPNHVENPTPYMYCTRCAHVGGVVAQPLPETAGGNPYPQQLYMYPSAPGGIMYPQVPMTYTQNAYTYQNSPPVWVRGNHSGQPMNPGWAQ